MGGSTCREVYKERECTLGEVEFAVMMVLGGGCWPGGEWAVGDGTNQGQGENPPLLPRGIIGGAGYPQYFIPLSHLSLEF